MARLNARRAVGGCAADAVNKVVFARLKRCLKRRKKNAAKKAVAPEMTSPTSSKTESDMADKPVKATRPLRSKQTYTVLRVSEDIEKDDMSEIIQAGLPSSFFSTCPRHAQSVHRSSNGS